MKVGIWNIAGALARGINDKAWQELWGDLGVDVALVQEAYVTPEVGRVVGQPFVEHPGSPSRWGTYVVARPDGPAIEAVSRNPVGVDEPHAIEDSYPATTAIARVTVDGVSVHLISVYGALTGTPTRHAETSMHRVLSDLTDLIATGEPVLLAGDFKVTTQPYASGDPSGWWHDQDLIVFQRLGALGMIDLIDQSLPDDYMAPPNCPCSASRCRHVRTTRHRHDPESTPYQNDWVYGTKAMAGLVTSCSVVDNEDHWSVSDHAPIVVSFD